MKQLIQVWERCPIVVKAVLSAIVIALAGSIPWSILAFVNTKLGPSIPWSVPAMVGYLWLYWQYLKGRGWPRSTAEIRHSHLRAGALSGRAWRWSLLAGSFALVSLTAFTNLASRFIRVPQAPLPDLSQYSSFTIFSFILMSAVVAGMTEEAAFRGYMQAPIERRYGILIALLIVGILFGFWHFDHTEVSFINLPYYLAVSMIYGMLAYRTGSILPAVVLHVGGNALVDLLLWWRGPSAMAPLIWQSGIDLSFSLNLTEALLFGFAAVLVYKKLVHVMQIEKSIKAGIV